MTQKDTESKRTFMEILKTIRREIETYLAFFELREKSLMFGFETAIIGKSESLVLKEMTKVFSLEADEYEAFKLEAESLFAEIERSIFAIINRPAENYKIVLFRITTSQIFIHVEKESTGDIVPILTIQGKAFAETLSEHYELVKATESMAWDYGAKQNEFLS